MERMFILIDVEQRPGKNGVDYWRLTFQAIDNNEVVEMTVDSTYKNFERSGWKHVVRHPCPWGVYQGLRKTQRKTRSGIPVVTADTPANIIHRLTSHEQALELAQLSIEEETPRARFGSLFT